MSNARQRRWRRRSIAALLTLLVLWLAISGWSGWQLRRMALSLHQQLTTASLEDGPTLCASVHELGHSGRRLRTLLLPTMPLLRHLGWLPRLGAGLATLPALSDAGVHLASSIDAVCQQLKPVWPALVAAAPQGPGAMLTTLQLPTWPWPTLQSELAAARQAWATIPEATWSRWPFAGVSQLSQVDQLLDDASGALRLGPVGGALLALQADEQPLQLLVAVQNPAELRPGGGFLGTVGLLSLHQGRLTPAAFQNSADLGQIAGRSSAMPAAYQRYLRASIWTLRDANWWPDWPQSARVLESFWELNEQPPVAGVLGVDSFFFADLLHIFGPLELPGYGSIASLQSLYQHYEGPEGGNKLLLGAVFGGLIERIQQSSARQALSLAASLARNLDERHVQLLLHDATVSKELAAQGWEGMARPAPGSQHVQVVDADLSYSDVQFFIDQQIAVEQELDASGAPITTSVTITYTNRYDPWTAASSQQQIYGYCLDVATRQQQRIPGCYGDYVRVYGPPGLELIGVAGADASGEIERSPERAAIGAYLVVLPGETRSLTVAYRQPLAGRAPYQFSAFKQAGTAARPLSLTIQTASGQRSTIRSTLHTDQHWLVGADGRIAGADFDADPALFERQPAFWQGWEEWLAGSTAAASERWRRSNSLELAIGQAWAMRWRASDATALGMLEALAPALDGAAQQHARFLEAQILEQTQPLAAAALYRELLAQNSQLSQVRLALALTLLDAGHPEAAREELANDPQASVQLHRRAQDLQSQQQLAAADQVLELLLALDPQDSAAWEARYRIRRSQTTPPDWPGIVALCDDVLREAVEPALWLERRAEAWQWLERPLAARNDLRQVVELLPTNGLAWYKLGLLEAADDPQRGITALQAARTNHYPDELSIAITLGRLYAATDQPASARQEYQHALELDPNRPDVQAALQALAP